MTLFGVRKAKYVYCKIGSVSILSRRSSCFMDSVDRGVPKDV